MPNFFGHVIEALKAAEACAVLTVEPGGRSQSDGSEKDHKKKIDLPPVSISRCFGFDTEH